jgi:hypothetical protein
MADTNKRKVTINFPGGSLTANYGLMVAVFGENKVGAAMVPVLQQIEREGHPREVVIGQPAINVRPASYVRKKYPSSQTYAAGNGEPIRIRYAGDWWTFRLSGSHQDFNDFLGGELTEEEAGGGALYWRSEKGSKYGPFKRP